MAKAHDNPTGWQLRPFKLEFNTIHRASIESHTNDGLSRIKSKNEDITPLDDESPNLSIVQKSLANADSTVEHKLETLEKPRAILFSSIGSFAYCKI